MDQSGLASFRNQLTNISRENADRMALIEKRATEQAQQAKAQSDKQMKTVSAVVVRLNERNRRIKDAGGWDVKDSDEDRVLTFGQLDDDESGLESEPTIPAWSPPEIPAPPAGRHARRSEDFDDEDYSSTNWLR